jgi:hypothetical protein
MCPVQSLVATTVTVAGKMPAARMLNGANDKPAFGRVTLPEPSTVPVPVPLMPSTVTGRPEPAIVNEPTQFAGVLTPEQPNWTEIEPGFPTSAPAARIDHGTARARMASARTTSAPRRRE